MTIDNQKYGRLIPFLGMLGFLFFIAAVPLFPGSLKIKELGKINASNYSDVFINKNYVYCTNGAGLDILDIQTPAAPKRIGYYESPGTALGVEVRHDYAFIADGSQGLQVLNVSNPANPVRVGNWNSIGSSDDYLSSVYVRGDYTYAISDGAGLLIFDTSTPSKPTLVGKFTYENSCGDDDPDANCISPKDVFVNFQYAYLVDFTLGLLVVDLTDPSSPHLEAWKKIPANVYGIFVIGDYAYLAAGRKGLQVMDISNPSNPVPVANYYGPENHDTTDVFISGTQAYVSYDDQLDIVDISSPLSPVRTARYTGCLAEKVFARGNYAYVINGYRVDFTVLDISNPYSPFQVGELDNPDEPRSIALKNNYAFLSDRQNRVWVVNVADAANPVIAGKYASPDYEYNVAVKGNYAYLTSIYPLDFFHPYGGLKVMNISNPVFPYLVGQCDTPGVPSGIFVSGNYAYIPDGEENGLAIIDISNPSAPVNVGNYVQPGTNDAARGVFVKGNYAYLAYEDNGLYILDISTPSNPKLTGKYQNEGDTVMGVTVRDNYAYLSSLSEGLVIVDISDPVHPVPMGRFKINNHCYSAPVLAGDYAYLLSGNGGIFAMDITDPFSPSLACNYGDSNTLGWGQDLKVDGNKLYAATSSGFYILEIQPVTSTVTLTVQSTPYLEAPITVTPTDINQKGDGTTNFTRSYTTGTVVTLTAPAEHRGKNFSKWKVDGVDRTTERNLSITMNSNHTAVAGYEDEGVPVIALNRDRFDFGVKLPVEQMVETGAQTLVIENSGSGTLNWQAIPSANWLQVNPSIGTGYGEVRVSVNAAGLSWGTYTGTIMISDPVAANSPQTVSVTLKVYMATNPPFGSFDTPQHGAVVQGSIAVTGWALDDIGIDSVKIYRDENNSPVYIGDAVLVEGARPDIEAAYPDYPNSSKAGWGYMMLTNFLPGGGNGWFTIYVVIKDKEGYSVTPNPINIKCDNAHAIRPFGAIDTPAQGGTASGSHYLNYGWALTPPPNTIPTDGSAIHVWVDGVFLGHPVYNQYRPDVAALFPGYNNSNGAGGCFTLDTTRYENGVHTIFWTAVDNAGNMDGIGSRYFSIQNLNGSEIQNYKLQNTNYKQITNPKLQITNIAASFGPAAARPTQEGLIGTAPRADHLSAPLLGRRGFGEAPFTTGHLFIQKGYNPNNEPEVLSPGENGRYTIEIKELERVVIYLGDLETESASGEYKKQTEPHNGFIEKDSGEPGVHPIVSNSHLTLNTQHLTLKNTPSHQYEGYLVNDNDLKPLPIGSTLDGERGVFYWQPGPGFLGEYRLVFVKTDREGNTIGKEVQVNIIPKF